MPTVDSFLPDIIQTTFFSGYTVFNTIVYTLILVIFILAIIKMFKNLQTSKLFCIESQVLTAKVPCVKIEPRRAK